LNKLGYIDGNRIRMGNETLWSDFPSIANPSSAFGIMEDFLGGCIGDVTSLWTLDAINGTATLVRGAGAQGGILKMDTTATADNDFVNVKLSDTDLGGPFKITKNSGKKLWFEAYVDTSYAISEIMCLVGLVPETVTEAVGNDTGAFNGDDGVYFRILAATPSEWDVACSKGTHETEILGAAAVNAGDWHTFGIHFDGVNTVTFYIDGAAVGTSAADATNWPDDVHLTPMFCVKSGNAVPASRVLEVDYIKCYQQR